MRDRAPQLGDGTRVPVPGVSCLSLFVAIRPQVRTVGVCIGLAFLLVGAVGMTDAAIFTSDPITVSQDELTTHDNLHGLGASRHPPLPDRFQAYPDGAWLRTRPGPRRSDRFYGRSVWSGLACWCLSCPWP